MSRQQIPQDPDVQPKEDLRALDVPHRAFHVGDPIPSVCYTEHVAALLQVSVSRVHQLHHEGRLRDFLLPSIGGRLQFNGKRLSDWREGKFEPKAFRIVTRKAR